MRYSKPTTNDFKAVELGCGAGANIPFFLSLGVKYYSVEASEVIVSQLHETYPELENKIIVGDFADTLPSWQVLFDI